MEIFHEIPYHSIDIYFCYVRNYSFFLLIDLQMTIAQSLDHLPTN